MTRPRGGMIRGYLDAPSLLPRIIGRELRRRITRRLLANCGRSFKTGTTAAAIAVTTWPPIRSEGELRALSMRLDWFLPLEQLSQPVWIPAEPGIPGAEGQFRIVVDDHQWKRCLDTATIVLNWKLLSSASLRLQSHLSKLAIIDPTWYYQTEAREWTRIFHSVVGSETTRDLHQLSARNFAGWTAIQDHPSILNVCGNGPGLERIYSVAVNEQTNVICNAAITSDRLLNHLRPAAVAFCDHYYFGPSDFARDFINCVRRCVERYDSFVFVPAGLAHWLLSKHYPDLRRRLIGLSGIASPPAIEQPIAPTTERLVVKSVGNVVTDMLMPIAASLRPKTIQVWGCDGRTPGERSLWSYLPELERTSASAAVMHPAYFRDRLESERASSRRYQLHCEYMNTLCDYIETLGTEVLTASPSCIPALQQRRKTSPCLLRF